MRLTLIVLSLSACTALSQGSQPETMDCVSVLMQGVAPGSDLRHCQNAQADCYLTETGGISCKWK